jgi:hypothetical protein
MSAILLKFQNAFVKFINSYRTATKLCAILKRNLFLPRFLKYCDEIEWSGFNCIQSINAGRRLVDKSFESIQRLTACILNVNDLLNVVVQSERDMLKLIEQERILAADTILAFNKTSILNAWNPWSGRTMNPWSGRTMNPWSGKSIAVLHA